MIIIRNINDSKFSINGITYYKNFIPNVIGSQLRIINVYDSSMILSELNDAANYEVDGIVHPSLNELQEVLLPVLYNRTGNNNSDNNSSTRVITMLQPILTTGPNKLTIPVVKDDILYPIKWIIFGQEFQYNNEIQFSIDSASLNHYRIDIIVGTREGTIILKKGSENESGVVPPTISENEVELTRVTIFGNNVIGIENPNLGNSLVAKEFSNITIYGGNVTTLSIPVNGKTHFSFNPNANVTFFGFSIPVNSLPNLYEGKLFWLQNRSNFNISLAHKEPGYDLQFYFENELPFVLGPKKNELFRYSEVRGLERVFTNLTGIKSKRLIVDTDPAPLVTGVVGTVVVKSWFIPAGSIPADCLLQVSYKLTKTSGSGATPVTCGFSTNINTQRISFNTTWSAGQLYFGLVKTPKVQANKLRVHGNSGAFYTDYLTGAAYVSQDFNPLVNQTLYLSVTLSSVTDEVSFESLILEVLSHE